jgi:putative phosphoribosyl transferase
LGSKNRQVLDRNGWARPWMRCPTDLAILPGATHLSAEAGALERMADLAAGCFRRWLVTEAGHAQV